MNIFGTRELYMQACHRAKDLHAMTAEERERLQAHLRKMYKEIETVCDRHGLIVMLAYGSVIGALRHKGFIPWDDDIDLFMPREDYDKLINVFAHELPPNYKIFAPNSKNGPIYRFAKVIDTSTRFITPGADRSLETKGVFVDIFPLENAPINRRDIRWQQFKSSTIMYIATSVVSYKCNNKKYKKIMCSTIPGAFNFCFRWIIGFLFSWATPEQWFNIFDCSVRHNTKTGYYNIPSAGPKQKYFLPMKKSLFEPVRKVPFDDIEAYIPHEAETLLELEYGDWHKIPSEQERWVHFIEEIKI